ncbi:Glutathionylspermidine synthase [Microlunatus sagamiharensis]|uniref:Glutathionylspermidine synthase n=1 Tax=Microlunatus sagamiharensis TaxID=546874 RepID=A0A1H2LHB7_9ACTN|nr:glutathionylspermidine synthase family protein [Microlunatus sagamiharensis]SDU79961.1 Glutathionylspermidine synthase [Microlunatus sagamiharensis]
MERRPTGKTRDNWPQLVADQGLTYWQTQLPDGRTRSYWSEAAHYAFSAAEVEQMHADATTLFEMCVSAGDWMLAHPETTDKMGIPRWALPAISATWNRTPEWGSVYGRFDVVYGGNRLLDPACTDLQDGADEALGRIRLYEFNADTPTSLLEAAVIQWAWFDQTRQGDDQWNEIYEMLVAAWRRNLAEAEEALGHKPVVHFACTWQDNLLPELAHLVPPEQRGDVRVEGSSYEDLQNLRVMQQACTDAGYETRWLYVEKIHLGEDGRFYDGTSGVAGDHLDIVFKLYPWEHMVAEEFGPAVFEDMRRAGGTVWIEPPYKMLWSNKGLLPVLWQLYGRDPERSRLLIPAWFEGEQPDGLESYVRKPILGREGANVRVVVDGQTVLDTPGPYGDEPGVIQLYAPSPDFVGFEGDNYATLGIFVVDGEPAGLDIRENQTVVVDNLSVCVPHVVRS